MRTPSNACILLLVSVGLFMNVAADVVGPQKAADVDPVHEAKRNVLSFHIIDVALQNSNKSAEQHLSLCFFQHIPAL